MSDFIVERVPADLVATAVEVARERGTDVADIPLTALAAAAGVSRSTLLRRIGGSRRGLDAAVRAAGIDPGGRPPVRERAVEEGAQLISDAGLGALTLDAVAERADCSVHSLYAAFGGRDGLLAAIYERFSPLADLQDIVLDPAGTLHETVTDVLRAILVTFGREPQVTPAVLADAFARSDGPGGVLLERYFPRLAGTLGGWFDAQVRAGRVRPLPVPLLLQQLFAPIVVHILMRPVLVKTVGVNFASLDDICVIFADNFVRAVEVRD